MNKQFLIFFLTVALSLPQAFAALQSEDSLIHLPKDSTLWIGNDINIIPNSGATALPALAGSREVNCLINHTSSPFARVLRAGRTLKIASVKWKPEQTDLPPSEVIVEVVILEVSGAQGINSFSCNRRFPARKVTLGDFTSAIKAFGGELKLSDPIEME